ncbi:hypothetical protein HELRODRAFT_85194, partial [Helobdella robusta]|uniref:DNA mismatch repair protein S5 domain-containing protein n=1 Tax=Helobdella robusta TaxID=6412 RepID=T1G5U1_HELRO
MQKLSQELLTFMRCTVIITDFHKVVFELVLNSLDAKATCIDISVSFNNGGRIHISDNGISMGYEDMLTVGQRYFTSKCQSINDLSTNQCFGYHGESLSSIINLCEKLEIKCTSDDHIFLKEFHKGVLVKFETHLNENSKTRKFNTEITVTKVFYKMSVRIKELDKLSEFEIIKRFVISISLLKPYISISLNVLENSFLTFELKSMKSVLDVVNYLSGDVKSDNIEKVKLKICNGRLDGFIWISDLHGVNMNYLYFNNKPISLNDKFYEILSKTFKRVKIFSK